MPPGGMRGAMRTFRRDSSVLQETVRPGTTARIVALASPYAGMLAVFFILVILDAGIGIANPLIYRAIIDSGILLHNTSLIIELALLVGVLALFDAGLSLAQQYISA